MINTCNNDRTYIFGHRFMRENSLKMVKITLQKDPDKKRKSHHMGKYF